MTATAIRYAGLTRDAVAVIVSTGSTVDWCFMSDGLKQAERLKWLRKGTPVPAGTVTESFNARPENIRTAQKDSGDGRLNDWIEAGRIYKVTEEVGGLGSYGRTLTVLTCRNLTMRIEADDEGDNEEELIESWTPRFRALTTRVLLSTPCYFLICACEILVGAAYFAMPCSMLARHDFRPVRRTH
jgi:hypothetical protein